MEGSGVREGGQGAGFALSLLVALSIPISWMKFISSLRGSIELRCSIECF